MAIEPKRLCQYRKVGGLYLCGEYISVSCDRLPIPLTVCPVCGQGIKVSRGFTQINPYRLWGPHDKRPSNRNIATIIGQVVGMGGEICKDRIRPCHVCDPQDQPAYIMLVGAGSYKNTEDFLDEAARMGISKRIPFIPKGLKLGETVIYLAHPKACEVKVAPVLQQAMGIVEESETKQPRLLETERNEKKLGIFCAFIPKKVEKLIWKSELTDEKREQLKKRGITPVPIPDGDKDHA
ncbi:hypothetical protein ES703_90490 [subsurface metagenome]